MKKFGTVSALLMTLVMILTVGLTAFASGTGQDPQASSKNDSITVNNAKPGETYELYKLFDLTVNDESAPTAYSYTVNADWAAFFAEGGDGHSYITVNEAGYVTAIIDSDAEALAKAAAAWSGKPAPTQTVIVGDGETTAVFSGLADGYWLITSTLGTIAMTETTPDSAAVTINEKNPENTIEKEVKEDSADDYATDNDAQIGDVVEFKSTVNIVKGTRNVVVHDKMDAGLTYTAGSVAIEGLTKGTEYTVNEETTDGDTFDITFTQSWIDSLDFGTDGFIKYEITYTATLNETAVVSGSDGIAIETQYNKTHISFGDATESTEDSTSTTTHKFSVFKHAKNSTDNLAGAVFSLKKAGTVVPLIKIDDNNYRVAMPNETGVDTFTTVASGDIVIWGVDTDDDYTLAEITPPSGYNKLTEEVDVTVDDGNGTRIPIENNSGTELPSTGGIGTKIFTIVGGILIVGAGLALVVRRRMNRG
jgi:LPXTG-motif cell wall-anchored protein